MCAWFPEIDFVYTCVCVCMCVCVCLPLRLLITSAHGVIRTPHDWLNKSYNFYIAAIVIIGTECGLRIKLKHIIYVRIKTNLVRQSYIALQAIAFTFAVV